MTALTDLQAAEAANHVAIQSVIQYLDGLPALISAAQGADDATVASLTAQVQADTAAIQAALGGAPAETAPGGGDTTTAPTGG